MFTRQYKGIDKFSLNIGWQFYEIGSNRFFVFDSKKLKGDKGIIEGVWAKVIYCSIMEGLSKSFRLLSSSFPDEKENYLSDEFQKLCSYLKTLE